MDSQQKADINQTKRNLPPLHKSFSSLFVGLVAYAICQWGTLILLVKFCSPEMVGQYTLGLAVVTPVFTLTSLDLNSVQVTDIKDDFVFKDYLTLRLLTTLLAIILALAVSLILRYHQHTQLVIFVICLVRACESISEIFYGLFLKLEQTQSIAISYILKGGLSILLVGLSVYISHEILWGVIGLMLSRLIVLVGYDLPGSKKVLKQAKAHSSSDQINPEIQKEIVPKRFFSKVLLKMAWLALPMGIVSMLISLNINIPRYVIEQYLGERSLGIFGAIAYLMLVGDMVISALGASATPRLSRYYQSGDYKAFRNLLFKLEIVAICMGGLILITLSIIGKQILTLLYRPEYAEYIGLLIWLMLAASIEDTTAFVGRAITSAKYFRIKVPIALAVVTTSAVSSLWLIPKYGLQGVPLTLMVAAIVEAGLNWGVMFYILHKLKLRSQLRADL